MTKNEEILMLPVAEFLQKANTLIDVYTNNKDFEDGPRLFIYRDSITKALRTLESLIQDEEYSMLDEFFEGQFNSIDPNEFLDGLITPESLSGVEKYSEFGA
jgi:hypothetical protein